MGPWFGVLDRLEMPQNSAKLIVPSSWYFLPFLGWLLHCFLTHSQLINRVAMVFGEFCGIIHLLWGSSALDHKAWVPHVLNGCLCKLCICCSSCPSVLSRWVCRLILECLNQDSPKGGKWTGVAEMTEEEALAEQQRMFAEARARMNGTSIPKQLDSDRSIES